MGKIIQKDELIQLHMFLTQLRSNLEELVKPKSNHFISYESLDISPQKIFKSKREQKLAIFVLSIGIADLIRDDNASAFEELRFFLDETCKKLRK